MARLPPRRTLVVVGDHSYLTLAHEEAKILELAWPAAAQVLIIVILTGLITGLTPSLRSYMAIIMPLALGIAAIAAGTATLVRMHPDSTQVLRLLLSIEAMTAPIWHVTCLALGLVAATSMFFLEAGLNSLWIRMQRRFSNNMHTLSFFGAPMPGRVESMRQVAQVASQPILFAALSVFSAAAEEFFYRGVLLLATMEFEDKVVYPLLLQAIWYGLNHVAFGVPAVIGKTILGISLGAVALAGGLLPALVGHVFYQYLVYRQFTTRPRGGRFRKKQIGEEQP